MGGTLTTGRRNALSIALALLLAMTLMSIAPRANAQDGDVRITIESNRADLISDGNALVQVHLPEGADASTLTVEVGGTDVSDAFTERPNDKIMGLVDELPIGDTEVLAQLADGRGATITITNHPVGGPVFSGPQIQPWACRTEDSGLDAATDEQCNAETLVEYLYMPEGGEGLEAYDVDSPPTDVAMTTTDQDKEVPFIVRHERGTMNRGVYAVAVLEDPDSPMEPWNPEPHAWNHKIHWPYGASCGVHKGQTTPTGVLDEAKLADGFMIANNSLNILGDNCSTITSAEASMMLQEHIKENFGEIRHVIGTGCSGGSIGQNMISNNYPGLLDGIIPNCTYVDNYSTGMEVIDCHIMLNHFTATSPQLWGSPAAQSALLDQQGPGACAAWEGTFATISDPSSTNAITGCDLPASEVYDPDTNPEGVRCTLQDYMINLWGERPEAEWGPVEQEIGRGFANAPYDNVGVEYGLKALRNGDIFPNQFVDVNANLESVDVDLQFVEGRTKANDFTVETIYRSGSFNDTARMDEVAIIDLRGSSNLADIHTDHHSYALRQRLIDAHGDHDNAVLWTWQAQGAVVVGITPSQSMADAAFRVMDEWLTAVEADDSTSSKADKIVANKPDEAIDKCFSSPQYSSEMDATQEECEESFPHFGAPRTGATMPVSHDVAKCVLVPLPAALPTDGTYGNASLWTGTSWDAYRAAHPDGVCDYTETNELRTESIPWLSFVDGPGGEPIGDAPVSEPFSISEVATERFGGATRIETAVLTSGRDRDSASTVVLARADNFADALSAAPLAVDLDAALLLTNTNTLPAPTLAEITRLGATDILIVGGEAAISQGVVEALEAEELTVRRISGPDRTATAAASTAELTDLNEVFVANSDSFPDGLTASTLAAVLGEGFLLVEADQIPAATAEMLDEGIDVTIVGGTTAVSDAVATQLDEAAGTVSRISGATRYETSVAGAQQALDRGITPDVVWIATGADFPDALVAGAAAARDGGLLVLIDGQDTSRSPEAITFLEGLAGEVTSLRIAGGPVAISTVAAADVARALG